MIIKPIAATLTTLVLLSSAIASSTVSAAEYEAYFEKPQASSTTTRAEVKRETVQAQQAGAIVTGELGAGYAPATDRNGNRTVIASKSRAEVLAELRQARNDGTLVENNSEIGQLAVPKLAGTSRSRADVRAEAIRSAQGNQAGSGATGN
ncbi:MAG: DUF4148 domain-containing protein [Herminiimonas sp.]|nr:DUF4148 domain-containing protein [Herminiimonas sp.]